METDESEFDILYNQILDLIEDAINQSKIKKKDVSEFLGVSTPALNAIIKERRTELSLRKFLKLAKFLEIEGLWTNTNVSKSGSEEGLVALNPEQITKNVAGINEKFDILEKKVDKQNEELKSLLEEVLKRLPKKE